MKKKVKTKQTSIKKKERKKSVKIRRIITGEIIEWSGYDGRKLKSKTTTGAVEGSQRYDKMKHNDDEEV